MSADAENLEYVDVADLRLDMFVPLVGTGFAVDYSDHQETLTLTSAEPLTDWSGRGRAAGCFRLEFIGSSTERMLIQSIHRLSHPALGIIEIALDPRARLPGGTFFYDATFN